MTKGVIVVLAMVLGLWACEKEQKPKGILSEQKMVKALSEIYLMEEKVGRLAVSRDSVEKAFPNLRERILQGVNINDSVFIRSLNYYMAYPDKMEQIYTALVDSLSLRTQQAIATDSVLRKNVVPQ